VNLLDKAASESYLMWKYADSPPYLKYMLWKVAGEGEKAVDLFLGALKKGTEGLKGAGFTPLTGDLATKAKQAHIDQLIQEGRAAGHNTANAYKYAADSLGVAPEAFESAVHDYTKGARLSPERSYRMALEDVSKEPNYFYHPEHGVIAHGSTGPTHLGKVEGVSPKLPEAATEAKDMELKNIKATGKTTKDLVHGLKNPNKVEEAATEAKKGWYKPWMGYGAAGVGGLAAGGLLFGGNKD
jgi:hypothetical protein